MSRFLFATMPATGHVAPKLPIARELAARGHDVHWYTGAVYRSQVEAVGAVHHPIGSAEDFGGETIGGVSGAARLGWPCDGPSRL
jgi:UDP:flavonoid glycosyltransferase YjiC (YdhE family)